MIYIMMKPASGRCNMQCNYCFYKDEMTKRSICDFGIMKDETIELIVKKSIEKAKRECVFAYQGGEPTLAGISFFEKSIEYQKKYNVKGIKIQNVIQTNGYEIDENWCRFFRENNFLVGVSLDGVKYTHDMFRKNVKGEDTYFTVIKNIDMLKKYNVDFNILTVVNKVTANKIGKIYEHYAKMGFYYQQYIACMEPVGDKACNHSYSITPQEYGSFLCRLFELWKIDKEKGKEIYIRQFENWLTILRGGVPEACEQRGICSAQLIIEADGSVYPCDFFAMDDYIIGNIHKDSLEEIEEKRKNSGFIEASYNHTKECLECKYFRVCRGNCNRYRVQGKHSLCLGFWNFFEQKYEDLVKMSLKK